MSSPIPTAARTSLRSPAMANAALPEQARPRPRRRRRSRRSPTGLRRSPRRSSDSSSASSTSGANQNGASPSAMLANLQSALTTYEASPTSSSAADAAVSSRRRSSRRVAQQRQRRGRSRCASRPTRTWPPRSSTINSLLNQFTAANNAVVTGLRDRRQRRQRRGCARFDRDPALQQIGVSTITAANGSMSIYTDSGVTLFQDTPRTVSFTPTPTLVDGANGARGHGRRRADHRRRTRRCRSSRARSPATRRCATRSRPSIRPSSTRSPAASSTPSPKATSRRRPRCPRCRACSRRAGATSLPSMSATTGLAAAIEVNPNVDPSQGGDPTLYSATAASPTPETLPTPTIRPARRALPDASRSSSARSSATQSFDPSAGLGSSSSLADYANASVSWLQSREPAGEQRLILSERARHPGDRGAFERDRRQSRRRDDQHARTSKTPTLRRRSC